MERSYRGEVLLLVQIVVVFIHLSVLQVVHRGFVGLAPGIRRETYCAFRQRLGAANYGVDSEGIGGIRQGLRNCCEPL